MRLGVSTVSLNMGRKDEGPGQADKRSFSPQSRSWPQPSSWILRVWLERRGATIVEVGGRQTDAYRCEPVTWAAEVRCVSVFVHVRVCACAYQIFALGVVTVAKGHRADAWPLRVPSCLLVTLACFNRSLELGRNSCHDPWEPPAPRSWNGTELSGWGASLSLRVGGTCSEV